MTLLAQSSGTQCPDSPEGIASHTPSLWLPCCAIWLRSR